MADELQKHMRGTDEGAIESALQPKEIGWNETARKGTYKHLNGITFDKIPSEFTLSKTDSDAGAKGVGVDSSAFSLFSDTTVQAQLASQDTFLEKAAGVTLNLPVVGLNVNLSIPVIFASVGSMATVWISSFDFPGDGGTTLHIEGIPSEFLPVSNSKLLVPVYDNSVKVLGAVEMNTFTTRIAITVGVDDGSFNLAGNRGLVDTITLAYNLI